MFTHQITRKERVLQKEMDVSNNECHGEVFQESVYFVDSLLCGQFRYTEKFSKNLNALYQAYIIFFIQKLYFGAYIVRPNYDAE